MSDVRYERRVGLITPDMQRFEAPRADDMTDALRQQVCPFCGAGPFVVVAQHTYQKHGVTADQLREMAGMMLNESICDPTYSATRSEHTRRLIGEGTLISSGMSATGGRRVTPARKAQLRQLAAANAERLRAADTQAKIRASNAARMAPTRAAILEMLVNTSDGTRAIAKQLGVDRKTVQRVASVHGIDLAARCVQP